MKILLLVLPILIADIVYANPKPTPAPTPLTMVLTVNKRTGTIIKQSIPAGTKIPCDTPVKVIYK